MFSGVVRAVDVRGIHFIDGECGRTTERRGSSGGGGLMVVESAAGAVIFLVARVLFGGLLAFMGFNHFTNAKPMAGYAEMKGLPAPTFSVVASGVVLLFGGLGIVLGVAPVLAAGALAAFLLVSAVTVHDFWAVPEDQTQDETTKFLKNVSLAGGALSLLAVGGQAWPYAVGVGLF